MSFEIIKPAQNQVQARHFESWFRAASEIRDAVYSTDEGYEFDPLRYNETATVGFLANAAGRANLFALPEYEAIKTKSDKSERSGRCDLWVGSGDGELHAMLELKLCWYLPGSRVKLITRLNEAIECAHKRSAREAGERWGGVVYCPVQKWLRLGEKRRSEWQAPLNLRELARYVDFACLLDGDAGPAFVLLKRLDPASRRLSKHTIPVDVLEPRLKAA